MYFRFSNSLDYKIRQLQRTSKHFLILNMGRKNSRTSCLLNFKSFQISPKYTSVEKLLSVKDIK